MQRVWRQSDENRSTLVQIISETTDVITNSRFCNTSPCRHKPPDKLENNTPTDSNDCNDRYTRYPSRPLCFSFGASAICVSGLTTFPGKFTIKLTSCQKSRQSTPSQKSTTMGTVCVGLVAILRKWHLPENTNLAHLILVYKVCSRHVVEKRKHSVFLAFVCHSHFPPPKRKGVNNAYLYRLFLQYFRFRKQWQR
jgi:hypothetical protein